MVIHQERISPQSQLFQYGPGDPLYPANFSTLDLGPDKSFLKCKLSQTYLHVLKRPHGDSSVKNLSSISV